VYNAAVMPLAVSGLLKPWMAALGMSLSSLLVVANASRLVRRRGPGHGRASGRGRVAAPEALPQAGSGAL
jgi:Cu2+-exporting ATPase